MVRAMASWLFAAWIACVALTTSAHATDAVPRRIVSMLPSLTETVCVLGHCDALVAVDQYSNWPQQVRALPRVGSLDGADIERIVALKPDLVMISASSRLTERLRSLGIRVFSEEPHTLADVHASISRVAALLGDPAGGEALWKEIDGGIDAAAKGLPARARGLHVYFEVDSGPYAAGPQSHIGELLARLGAVNIVPAALGSVPRLNPEFVVRADPQVIFVTAGEAAALPRRPGWDRIRAVREGRVCALSRDEDDIVARPGPRLAQAADVLAQCLAQEARR